MVLLPARRSVVRFTALTIAACAVAWWIDDRRGWHSPGPATFRSHSPEPRFAEVGVAAGEILQAARARLGVPGISAAVSIDGRLVWAGAAGWADAATAKQLSPDSVFRIGSTSKAVTATLLARLVEAGTIALDAPISRYLPEPPNPEWAPLTPRQLASHTAGLPDYEENRDLWGLYQSIRLGRHFDDVVASLAVFDDTPLVYPPGTRFHYTSFDVNLLAAAMQSAVRVPYLQLLEREVLGPLGMASTGGDHAFAHPGQVVTFYELRDGRVRPWREVDLSQKWPSGGLLSTSSDLTRLCAGWFDAQFIAPGTAAEFWTPQALASGAVNEQGYALGWRVERDSPALGDGERTSRVHHGGVSKGAMSWLVCYPEARIGIALNINGVLERFASLSREEPQIARLFFEAARQPR